VTPREPLRLPPGVDDTELNRYACLRAGTVFGWRSDLGAVGLSRYESSVQLGNGCGPGEVDWRPVLAYDDGHRICEPCPVPGPECARLGCRGSGRCESRGMGFGP